MKVQPRQELIEIWKSIMRAVVAEDRSWAWGGKHARNPISDAEQLLCLMYPASVIPLFKIDRPDETTEDVLEALRPLGDSLDIPARITEIIIEYLETYTDETGAPTFSGGSYFASTVDNDEPTEAQQGLDVVDAYSMSITLTLYTIGFARVLRGVVRSADFLGRLSRLETLASQRLTAAMVGLLRSFTVHVFSPDSPEGRALIRSVNQSGGNPRQIAEELLGELSGVRAAVRDFTIGSGTSSELDNPSRLFEIGWSWSLVKGAPEIEGIEDIGKQRTGIALERPILYFTVNALDGIADLFTPRTVELRLLDETQQRLSQALRLRWQLTQSYWSTIASFGDGRWPLEDIPWRTTDSEESDYFSLLVTTMAIQDLEGRRATDDELRRLGSVLKELAERGRITRRAMTSDRAIGYHSPGVSMNLGGSDALGGPKLRWEVSDYAAVLMKRTLQLAGFARSAEMRDDLIGFGDRVWAHLLQRRMLDGPAAGLWDNPANVYDSLKAGTKRPNWYSTERVVECLVFATQLITSSPVHSSRLYDFARDLLNEADHLYDFEVLHGVAARGGRLQAELGRAQNDLARARELIRGRPGTAAALALDVLRFLNTLDVARQDASRRAATETV